MLFWIIATLLALVVAASLAPALFRGRNGDADGAHDIEIYRAQLAEVDRDVARGVLDPAEAERVRVEISRRLIAADKSDAGRQKGAASPAPGFAGAVAVFAVLAGSLGLYATLGAPGLPDMPRQLRIAAGDSARENRMSQSDAIAALGAAATAGRIEPPEEIRQSVDNLRAALSETPDDLEGWQILAAFETRTGNLPAAADAMAEIVRIKGVAATTDDLVRLADLMVYAAQGYVSPQTVSVLDRVAAVDPGNIAVRYYMGLLYDQTDRPDLAFELWRGVIAEGGVSLHAELARSAIGDAAWLSGRDYTPPPEMASPSAPGPTADQVAAAEDMAPEDRDAMIRGMVSQLNDRLAAEGGPPEDWARLVASYAVLGDTDAARAVLDEARGIFAESAPALDLLRGSAIEAGLEE